MGNGLNALPQSQQGRAKKALQNIWMAATRADALVRFNDFVESYSATYPKAAEKLIEARDERLTFYDFPAEHWQHLRTTNPIESTFASGAGSGHRRSLQRSSVELRLKTVSR